MLGTIRRWSIVSLAMALCGLSTARAEDVVKVGMIMSQSGPFGIYGTYTQRGIDMFIDKFGDKVGNTKIEVVWRDEAGGPEHSKTAAQELIVSEGVQFLAGFNLTPDAFAVAPLINQSKTPTLLLTAASGNITRMSPYFARLSFTVWQSTYTAAMWAPKHGLKTAVFAYSDFAPGVDGLNAFKAALPKAGGDLIGAVPMPLSTTDFGAYVQKIRDMKPEFVFLYVPNGPPQVSFIKAFASYGLPAAGIKLIAAADEMDLPAIGDAGLGVLSVWHYSPDLPNEENKQFVAAYHKKYGENEMPNFQVVASYDAMQAIASVIQKLGPKFTGDQAIDALKGWKINSVRGPIEIDPVERDIIQNQYVRVIEKSPSGGVRSHTLETIPMVADPWKALNPPK